jgi:hypothetical protein
MGLQLRTVSRCRPDAPPGGYSSERKENCRFCLRCWNGGARPWYKSGISGTSSLRNRCAARRAAFLYGARLALPSSEHVTRGSPPQTAPRDISLVERDQKEVAPSCRIYSVASCCLSRVRPRVRLGGVVASVVETAAGAWFITGDTVRGENLVSERCARSSTAQSGCRSTHSPTSEAPVSRSRMHSVRIVRRFLSTVL